ncbi:MAG: hypothetical protein WBC96_01420 [Thermodesulfobacteriota bacterium]
MIETICYLLVDISCPTLFITDCALGNIQKLKTNETIPNGTIFETSSFINDIAEPNMTISSFNIKVMIVIF